MTPKIQLILLENQGAALTIYLHEKARGKGCFIVTAWKLTLRTAFNSLFCGPFQAVGYQSLVVRIQVSLRAMSELKIHDA